MFRALKASFCTISQTWPRSSFVPDLVEVLMVPPITPPNSAESLCDCTLNSSIVSIIGFKARLLKKVAWLGVPSNMYMLLRFTCPFTEGILDWPVATGVTPGVMRIKF